MNKKPGEYCGRPNGSAGSVHTCPGILQETPNGLYCPICHWHTSNKPECKPYEYKGKKVEVYSDDYLDYTGTFLEFTTIYEELNTGVGQYPAAIIMLNDGTLEIVGDLYKIKFVN
jgi:hypothetical protein